MSRVVLAAADEELALRVKQATDGDLSALPDDVRTTAQEPAMPPPEDPEPPPPICRESD